MKQEMMTIVSQVQLAPRIYEMTLTGQLVKEMTTPGQFIHILAPRADLLLRRPISINRIDHEHNTATIIYRTEGDGTKAFAALHAGDKVDVMGPLGNGYELARLAAGDTAYIVGGGIGIPPLYELSKQLILKGVHVVHFLGYADQSVTYFTEEFKALGETYFVTDDGSFGEKGNVGHLLKAYRGPEPKAVFACGNNGLLKAVEFLYADYDNVQLSLEARMACGMGACYACVCHKAEDESQKQSVKVCEDGPVFKAGEVIF
jgi:dihydroorotate dehydrogenase electron transfer subunit